MRYFSSGSLITLRRQFSQHEKNHLIVDISGSDSARNVKHFIRTPSYCDSRFSLSGLLRKMKRCGYYQLMCQAKLFLQCSVEILPQSQDQNEYDSDYVFWDVKISTWKLKHSVSQSVSLSLWCWSINFSYPLLPLTELSNSASAVWTQGGSTLKLHLTKHTHGRTHGPNLWVLRSICPLSSVRAKILESQMVHKAFCDKVSSSKGPISK